MYVVIKTDDNKDYTTTNIRIQITSTAWLMYAYCVMYSCVCNGHIPNLRIHSVRAINMYLKSELVCESW